VKRQLMPLFAIFLTAMSLPALEVNAGLKVSLSTAIGTGKGFWDWTAPGTELQRTIAPAAGASFLLDFETERNWALETGISYGENRFGLKVDSDTYLFRQPSLEIPLLLKIYFSEKSSRIYAKGGGSCLILLNSTEIGSSEDSKGPPAAVKPERHVHGGIHLGLGFETGARKGRWLTELQYTTFYTSPEYIRSDGSRGDIRFHRFDLSLGYLY